MFGRRMVASFEAVKDRFDPAGMLNPGKIVRAPRMDDRSLFRYPPGYRREPVATRLDWSGWPAGLHGAVEMCNNNGACRKLAGGAMCPSYRVTRNERDVTRGRANTLRLALTGQLGPDALASDAMAETLKLCVSCKACKRECPMSVDMAAMKVEVLAARAAKHGLSLRDRLVAHLPRYAPLAARAPWLANARDRLPGAARLSQRIAGLAADRPPAAVESRARSARTPATTTPDVILFADTFNRWFEPDAPARRRRPAPRRRLPRRLRPAAGARARSAAAAPSSPPASSTRPAPRWRAASPPSARPRPRRQPSSGSSPPACSPSATRRRASCPTGPRPTAAASSCSRSSSPPASTACRSGRSPAAPGSTATATRRPRTSWARSPRVLAAVPELEVRQIDSSCCGMAGAFGYQAETADVSRAMAELSLLPAVRAAGPADWIVADGTSCRHQIADGTGRRAVHVATLLRAACEAVAMTAPSGCGENRRR